ncbi:Sir2 family NAD-dependent protein deacetylase [Haloferacaceae archaeon DSL9]
MDDAVRDAVDAIAAELGRADRAVALTGAGLSTASGIPSFRGEDGIWGTEFDPESFHVSRFESDPEGFWADRLRLHERMFPDRVEPNAAHDALARLTNDGVLDAVITQNTDGLHAAAGTDAVIELHGNARRVVCHRCGDRAAAAESRERVRDGDNPPRCGCGGIYKPDVVLFGELLDREGLRRAKRLAAASDVFIVAGSSLQVHPAASLPAERRGATLVLVNFESTPFSANADYDLRADVTEVLPAIEASVRPR